MCRYKSLYVWCLLLRIGRGALLYYSSFLHLTLLFLLSISSLNLHQPLLALTVVSGSHKVGNEHEETTQAEHGAHPMHAPPHP